MGGIYAREDGEPEDVWKAIYYHYLPTSVEANAPPTRDDLGAAAVTWAAVSLADKLDTVVGLFAAAERPTGSRDPFALRRHAHGALRVLLDLTALTGLTVKPSLGPLIEAAQAPFGTIDGGAIGALWAFLQERLQYALEQRGFDIRNVRAMSGASKAVPLQQIRPAEALQKLEVLPEFTESDDFRKLAVAFKRVRNIARELSDDEFERQDGAGAAYLEARLTEPAERQLLDELIRRGPVIESVLTLGENYRRAFSEAAQFGPAVDRFFTEVFVMSDDPRLREARLRLMKRLENLILKLGDISEIVAQPET
jgi:glycyl-tRNA synthetase beta chain